MNLGLYYRMNHALQKYHKWGDSKINNSYPWERDIGIALINADLEKEKEAQ